MTDLFGNIDRGARVRTLCNELFTLVHVDRPRDEGELLQNHTIAQARKIRTAYNQGDITTEEAEIQLIALKFNLQNHTNTKPAETGFTPQLLNPEDTGELF